MRLLIYICTIFFLGFLPASAQNAKQIKREVDKQRKENAKASKRAKKYGKARHMSIQDKKTRKRMKKNLRESNKRHKSMSR